MPRPNVSEQRKLEILQAAARVFTVQGLGSARMEDVAAAAGVSKGTVYLYYPSKDSLIEALLHQLFMPLEHALDALMADTSAAVQRLQRYGEALLQTFDDARPLQPLVLELFALAPRQTFASALLTGYFERYRAGVTAILQAGAQSGELSLTAFAGQAQTAALSFISTLEGLLLLFLLNPALINLRGEGVAVLRAWVSQVLPDGSTSITP